MVSSIHAEDNNRSSSFVNCKSCSSNTLFLKSLLSPLVKNISEQSVVNEGYNSDRVLTMMDNGSFPTSISASTIKLLMKSTTALSKSFWKLDCNSAKIISIIDFTSSSLMRKISSFTKNRTSLKLYLNLFNSCRIMLSKYVTWVSSP
uniref:ORF OR26.28 protein n=1 Tax=Saccharomyces cerevisiae TaxID=4932 RepID=E9PA81_YEASX|nr:ORF OR26.28 [Saccharomyces cerevisiae]